jgi:hypothetical protein
MNDGEIREIIAAYNHPEVKSAVEMIAVFADGERLRKRIFASGKPDECWPFSGTKGKDGYGKVIAGAKRVRAHRAAFMLANKRPIPDGMIILHSCDVRLCCNPAHLTLGTHGDNGRHRRERGNHMPAQQKLTYFDAQEIREFYKAGCSLMSLAAVYGVGFSTVRHITEGKTYQKWPGWKPYDKSIGPNLHGPVLRVRPIAK